jgi:hypothetical protein
MPKQRLEFEVVFDETGMIKGLKKVDKGIDKTKKKTKEATKTTSKFATALKAIAGAFVVRKIVQGLVTVTKKAIDAQETISKFKTVFKDVSKESKIIAKNLSKDFGLSSVKAKELLSDTGDLLTGFGFTGKAALDLSKNVNELAVDLASFTNFSGGAEGASKALTKALLGERESVKSLGISILEEDVKKQMAIDRAKGLTFESERQAKAMATLTIAQNQSKNAIGDFARTSDQTANQIRIMKSRIEDFQIFLGTKLIPIVDKVVGFFNDNFNVNEDLITSTGNLKNIYVDYKNTLKKVTENTKDLSDKQKTLNTLQVANAKIKLYDAISSINKQFKKQTNELEKLEKKSKKYNEAVIRNDEAIKKANENEKTRVRVRIETGILLKELDTRTLSLAKAEKFAAITKLEGIKASEKAKQIDGELKQSLDNLILAQMSMKDINLATLISEEDLRIKFLRRMEDIKNGIVTIDELGGKEKEVSDKRIGLAIKDKQTLAEWVLNNKEAFDKVSGYADDYVKYAGGLSDSLNTIIQSNINKTSKSEKEKAKKSAILARTLYVFNQGLRHAEAVIDTFKAIIGFLANPGGIPGVALSVTAGIVGAAQQLAIAQAPKPPMPAFRSGGLVNAMVGENGPEMAALPHGSRVYNASETAGMLRGRGGTPMASSITDSHNQTRTFNIQNAYVQGNTEFDEQVDKRRRAGGDFL